MARPKIPEEQRKFSLTISCPHYMHTIKWKKGNAWFVDALKTGLWAVKHNINELTLNAMKENYEAKILKLQKMLEAKQ